MALSRQVGTNARAALPALRVVVLAVIALISITAAARSAERLAGPAMERVRACASDAARVRITGPFGCIETSHPYVTTDGIYCERIEPCDYETKLPSRSIPWEEITRVEVGHGHAREGGAIGAAIGLVGGVAVGFARTNRELGLAEMIRPLAIAIVATPFMVAGGLAGGLYGRSVITWDVCYQKAPASQALSTAPAPPAAPAPPPAAAESTRTR